MTFDHEREKRKTDVRELQDKAFLMFQQAKTLVNENKNDEAISVYLELIEILNILRWPNVSKKIQDAIRELQIAPGEELEELEKSEESDQIEEQIVEEKPHKMTFRGHAQSLKEFEMYKQQEESIQLEAFKLMDSGAALAAQKEFERAIEAYNQSIILLNSIGWQSYTPQIQDEIEHLVQEQKQYIESLQQRMEKPELQTIEDLRKKRETLQQEIDSRKITVKEFDERKKKQYNYLVRASQLLDECVVSVTNLEYHHIYETLQQAAQNLINVGWQEGVSSLTDFISAIKENQFQHELMEQQEHLAYIEKIRISDDIRKYFKKKMLEKEKEKASPFRQVEPNSVKLKTKSYEQQVYEVITEASQILGTDDESSKRKIELYNVAYHLVENSQWFDEIVKVQSIINILKTNLENRRQRIQTIEQNKESTLSSLHAHSQRIKEYMKEFDIEKEVQKAGLLKFQEQQHSIQSLENTAFKLIDTAKRNEKNLEFDEAVLAYEEAISKFKSLKWIEQISYLIEEIEKIKKRKAQFQSDLQLKDQLKQHEELQKQALIRDQKIQKEKEIQDLQDISKMISGVVEQKEIEQRNQQQSQEDYWKNVEKPEEDKQIQEFKDLIRKASRKKSENSSD
jgi:hypothetical protein